MKINGVAGKVSVETMDRGIFTVMKHIREVYGVSSNEFTRATKILNQFFNFDDPTEGIKAVRNSLYREFPDDSVAGILSYY